MSTHLPGFQSFSRFLRNFIFVKLVTSSIRVKNYGILLHSLKKKTSGELCQYWDLALVVSEPKNTAYFYHFAI